MLWMSVEGLSVELRVRGQLSSRVPLPRGLYNLTVPDAGSTQVVAQEARVNTSSGQRVVCVEYGPAGLGLDAQLLQISKRPELTIVLEPAEGGHPQDGPLRMAVESVWKYVTLFGRAANTEFPGQGRAVLCVSGTRVAELELYTPKTISGLTSCVVTAPTDVDAVVASAMQQGHDCVISVES